MARSLVLAYLASMLFLNLASAQGVLVSEGNFRFPRPRPMPPSTPALTYKIKQLAIQARVSDQVAQVQVTQSFVNTGSTVMEVQFVFPLPYDGAIDRLTLMVDGKEFPAKLLTATDARARYEAFLRASKDPALLEWIGNGFFQTSVFPVPPGAERVVTLNYSQLLRKSDGLTDLLIPLSTAKYTSGPIESFSLNVQIDSDIDIKNVFSSTHTVSVQRTEAKRAVASFTANNYLPNQDFRLFYDVDKGAIGAKVLSYKPGDSEDGFFLLLASPKFQSADTPRLAKTVIFVVDKSGSMTGKKIEQAKASLKFVLNNLREGDLFNIVAYDSKVESFRPELERYNEVNRLAAIGYIEGLYASCGTNIHGALTAALGQLKDGTRPSYLLFLTDGLPTVGEVRETAIATAAKSANQVHARLISFGVGYDVNSRLLDRLAGHHGGLSVYVRPDEDIETHVGRAFQGINAPVLTQVQLNWEYDGLKPEDGQPINRVYPSGSFDLFEGQQLVVAGRYRKSGPVKVRLEGKSGGETRGIDFPAELVVKSSNSSYAFVEKLWAQRRIGEIIDQIDLTGVNPELTKELTSLSLKHGILTPYTSFLADDQADRNHLLSLSEGLTRRNLGELEAESGKGGVAQREAKQLFKGAAIGGPAAGAGGGFQNSYRNAKTDKEVGTDAVRCSQTQTLYQRGQLLVTIDTSTLDLEKDKNKIATLVRFSPEYFKLVAANSADDNYLLSLQGPEEKLLIQFRDQIYLIE